MLPLNQKSLRLAGDAHSLAVSGALVYLADKQFGFLWKKKMKKGNGGYFS